MTIAALKVALCVSLQATWQYELFAVVAHSGSTSCGHYCAYIRSLTECKWYCFNDSEVCQVSRASHISFVPSWTLLQVSSSLTGCWLKRTRKGNWGCRALSTSATGCSDSHFCTKQGPRSCFVICRSSHLLSILLNVPYICLMYTFRTGFPPRVKAINQFIESCLVPGSAA